ncbi:MAG: hypothetical protein ACREAR_01905 [Nitrosotalea sp.]
MDLEIAKILAKNFIKTYKLPDTPDNLIDWTIAVRKIQGQQFSFEGREFLKSIYADQNKRIMIVKSRQMEMTEFAINWLLFNLSKNPNTVGIYITDTQKHVSIFSKMRLRGRAIGESSILQKLVHKEGNISLLMLKNGSYLYMFSAKPNFESARSIPVDFAVIDEIQSTNVEAIPVLEEALVRSPFGKCLYIGTGSIMGDGWFKRWHLGNQQEWDEEKNQWVAKNPDATDSSYHLTQEMSKKIPKEEIERKRREWPPHQFTTEVLGWWYGSSIKPLAEKDMHALFGVDLDFTLPENVDHTLPIFAGFDWGGGTQAFTVAWIWQLVNIDIPRFRLLYLERIDDPSTENQADRAIELMRKYQVDRAVMDAGGGTRQVEKMTKVFGNRIFKCNYHYDADKPFQIIRDELRVLVDRTWIIESIIDLIKRPEDKPNFPDGVPRIHIPAKEPLKVEWIIDHFTCIEAETANAQGKSFVKYTHPESLPDDALHAACYSYCAYLLAKKTDWHWFRL